MSDKRALNERGWPVFNTSAEEVPPFACMRILSSSAERNSLVVRIGKPDGNATSDPASRYAFNGPTPIPASRFGECFLAYPLLARVESTALSVGTSLGPVSGSWFLRGSAQNKLWRVSVIDEAKANFVDSQNRTVLISPIGGGGSLFGGTLTADLTGTSTTANVVTLEAVPVTVASGATVWDYRSIFTGAKSGASCIVLEQSGVYHLLNVACPFTY